MMKKINLVFAALTLTIGASHIQAKVSEEEAAKLGNELTPLGGDKSGNADGSIPPWTGGITSQVITIPTLILMTNCYLK